jgi:hypothetical protein
MLAFGLALMTATPAAAHHSFEAEYDSTRTATLTGVVTKFDWINPHAYIFMTIKDETGADKQMRVELGPPYSLTRQGWKRDTVKIGDKITVEGAALAKDPRNIWAGSLPTTFLVLPTGKLPMR